MNEEYSFREKKLSERDLEIEARLRPHIFSDFEGQRKIVDNLKVFVEAARLRDEALDHLLLHGPPGLGKTTLAHIVANEMEAQHFQVDRGFPLLRMESVSYSEHGEPVEYFIGLFRTDRASFVVDLVNVDPGQRQVGSSIDGEDFWLP